MPADANWARSRLGLERVDLLSPFCFVTPLGLFCYLFMYFGDTNLQTATGAFLESCAKIWWR